ncbi:MAG TPA: hypothetical protein VFT99_18345, partial [Roseiflexaceae bacterium]|nr:hypothetical protein [Roseiflexaceae bacterium]
MIPSRLHSKTTILATYLLVAVVALVPRIAQLDRFLTVDEADFWLNRSSQFLDALRAGNWAATAISTHP